MNFGVSVRWLGQLLLPAGSSKFDGGVYKQQPRLDPLRQESGPGVRYTETTVRKYDRNSRIRRYFSDPTAISCQISSFVYATINIVTRTSRRCRAPGKPRRPPPDKNYFTSRQIGVPRLFKHATYEIVKTEPENTQSPHLKSHSFRRKYLFNSDKYLFIFCKYLFDSNKFYLRSTGEIIFFSGLPLANRPAAGFIPLAAEARRTFAESVPSHILQSMFLI